MAKATENTGAVDCPTTGDYHSMWSLPDDMTYVYQEVAGHLGVDVHLLLQENPCGDGHNGPECSSAKQQLCSWQKTAICRFILCLAKD